MRFSDLIPRIKMEVPPAPPQPPQIDLEAVFRHQLEQESIGIGDIVLATKDARQFSLIVGGESPDWDYLPINNALTVCRGSATIYDGIKAHIAELLPSFGQTHKHFDGVLPTITVYLPASIQLSPDDLLYPYTADDERYRIKTIATLAPNLQRVEGVLIR